MQLLSSLAPSGLHATSFSSDAEPEVTEQRTGQLIPAREHDLYCPSQPYYMLGITIVHVDIDIPQWCFATKARSA